jgi:hypothetical protein
MQEQEKPDAFGRVWMHCNSGLNMSKKSTLSLVQFILKNRLELGSFYTLEPSDSKSQVFVSIKIHPDLIPDFERETRGILSKPPKIKLN